MINATPEMVPQELQQFFERADMNKSDDFFIFVCLIIDMFNAKGHTAELRIGDKGFYVMVDGKEFDRYDVSKVEAHPLNYLLDMIKKMSTLDHSPFRMLKANGES